MVVLLPKQTTSFNMKYRIIEFKAGINDERFFVETGKKVFEKVVGFIYLPKTIWDKDLIENNVKGYKTYSEAIKRIEEIKQAQPIIHNIR